MATGILQQHPRAAIYARISTTNHGQDTTMQTRELREYCERRGWKIANEYVDVGVSGSKEKRPELNKLFVDAHRRRFDIVLVCNLDLSTPSGRLMFQIIGAMAEFERALIQERVKAGMRNAQAKGRRIGRPPQTPLSTELRTVIAHTYASGGTSLRALARRFGTSLATVQRCIEVCQRVVREGPLST